TGPGQVLVIFPHASSTGRRIDIVEQGHEVGEQPLVDQRVDQMRDRTLEEAERLRYGELMLAMTPDEVMQRALEVLAENGVVAEEEEPDSETLPRLFRQGYLFVSG